MTYLSDNTYGIEIECYLPVGGTAAEAAMAVTDRLGGSNRCVAESYNHVTHSHWKIVTDGSLGDYARGIELVSPILTGESGVTDTLKVMEALTDYGCTVSRQCGLHIHVGVGVPRMGFFRNLLKLYAVYEPVIDGFLPPSRRQSQCQYARSVTSVSLTAIDQAASLDDLIRALTGRGGEQRYYKLNLAAYRRHRTVEFRQHSGTLDGQKARHWLLLCLRMVEAAKSETFALNSVAPGAALNRARRDSKAFIVGELMLRPEGVTAAEACAATGWLEISVPLQARRCGLAFTTQRTGRVMRYFAQAAAASQPATAVSLEGLFEFLGCEPAERDYFRARTASLSGPVAWAA